jgi:hypothetical protein
VKIGAVTTDFYTLPAVDGAANQVLTTNGAGVASWSAVPAGGNVNGAGTAGYLANWTDAATIGNTGVYQDANGNVGVGTTLPRTKLNIEGDGTILATGTYGSGVAVPDLGAGTRMMWYPTKAAFRAGYVNGTQWNNANVGTYSVAFGSGSRAFGTNSVALGGGNAAGGWSLAMNQATASGTGAIAMGDECRATGGHSVALGSYTTASGDYSTAINLYTIASGQRATAMGGNTNAHAYYSVALGNYNVVTGTTNAWVLTEPIFQIGIGTTSTATADAVTVLKNGNVGIGSTQPSELLQVAGNISSSGNVSAAYFSGNGAGLTDLPASGGNVSGTGTAGYLANWTDAATIGNTGVYQDASGHLGIGTTDPTTLVEIQQEGGGEAILINGINNGAPAITINKLGGSAAVMARMSDGAGPGFYVFCPSTDPFSSASIWASTPMSFAAFEATPEEYDGGGGLTHFAGRAVLSGRHLVSGGGISLVAPDTVGDLQFFTGGQELENERMRIDPTGNVGIGTSQPMALLQVAGNAAVASSLELTADADAGFTGQRFEGGEIVWYVQGEVVARLSKT